MTRKIKTRIWDTIELRYVDTTYMCIDCKGNVIELVPYEVPGEGTFPTAEHTGDRYIAEQSTGLTDSNDIEIYEGDIVRWDDASTGEYWKVAKVIMTDKMSWGFEIIRDKSINCFKNGATDIFHFGNFSYCPDTTRGGNVMEVIGNIHENLEL